MVSQERTGAGDRYFQCGDERRRNPHAPLCSAGCVAPWLALGLSVYGSARVRMARTLVESLQKAGRAPAMYCRRTRIHQERLCRYGRRDSMGSTVALQTDVGLCRRKIYGGPRLVVLSFLDTGLFTTRTWPKTHPNRLANSRDLFDLRHRKHRRRLVIFWFDPPRVFRKCRKKVGNACLRDLRRANRDGLPRVRAMAGNPPDRTCRRGTPGIFGEPF